jgi:hypothetical protein
MDRPDIDALLIGALYGELTPADEARLAAHLESHPADRSALEGMKATRDSVRASRIFEAQAEPPQAVSALLLQEAARRAPRRAPEPEARESWFHRFVRSFMSHPAMAAAAMLVLVIGVAGTLYVRHGGDQYADKTIDQAPTTTATLEQPVAPPPAAAPAQGSGYAVDLAEEEQQLRGKDAEKAEAPKADRKATSTTTATVGDSLAKAPAKHGKKGYIEVTTPEPMPKDLDKNDEGGEIAASNSYGAASGGGAPGAAPSVAAAPPPPPPPPQAVAQSLVTKPAPSKTAKPVAPKTVAKAPAEEPSPEPQQPAGPATDRGLYGWAKAQHQTAIAKVKAGDCAAAATLAVQVKTRAPDYYAQYMQGDRELKSCTAYIDDAQLRNESANSKQKATKRASDEPAAPTRK